MKRPKGGARSKISAGAKGANVDGESISAGGFSEGEVVERESTEKEQKTREPIQAVGRVFPKGAFAEVESLGKKEKSAEAILGKRLRTAFRYVIRYYQKYAIHMKFYFYF